MSVQATGAISVQEDRSLGTFTDTQVDGPGGAGSKGDGDDLGALAADGQGPMPPLQPEMFDVGAKRF